VLSPTLNSTREVAREVEWARLIPGEMREFGKKKQPVSVRVPSSERIAELSTAIPLSGQRRSFELFVPRPLQGPFGWTWLRATAADFALIGLNWLLIGAFLVPLRSVFPHVWAFRYAEGSPVSLLGFAALHAALITLIGHSEGLYCEGIDIHRQVRALGKAILWSTTLLTFANLLQGAPWTRAVLLGGAAGLHFGVLLAWRRQSFRQLAEDSRGVQKVLIVGAGEIGRRVASYLEQHPEARKEVYGFLDNEGNSGTQIIGRIADLPHLARKGFVDEVILAAPRDRHLTLQVLRAARRLHLNVGIVPELFGCRPALNEVAQIGDLPLVCLHTERFPAARLALKRCADVVGAFLALTLLSPLMAALAVLIKLDSKGPVIYRAPRAGRKGQLFRCYKFRSMVSNADELKSTLRRSNERSGPFFKLRDDPRITRMGRILRRYSLDELPQLWNVLKGDMSLVGPRPHPIDDYAAYAIEHFARLDVTPGITGLWQVTARRDPSFQRGMELDREYIYTWSLASDLRILLKTLLAVARGSGD